LLFLFSGVAGLLGCGIPDRDIGGLIERDDCSGSGIRVGTEAVPALIGCGSVIGDGVGPLARGDICKAPGKYSTLEQVG
jgi:hypothetical protein